MRNRTLLVLMTTLATTGAALGTAVAAPPAAKSPATKPGPAPTDSFHVTMVAGKGRLGLTVLQISPELRAHLGAPADRGVLVDSVRPDSPAAKAGVQVGDVIVDVDGEAAKSATDVLSALSDRKKGDAVDIVAMRGGNQTKLRATLEDDATMTWRGGKLDFGSMIEPQLERFFDDGWSLDSKALQDAKKQIDELEKRLRRLERQRS